MTSEISGKVLFANDRVAPGVEVRVFDRDAPGKVDDDLTAKSGQSDAYGNFAVTFEPGRFLDFVSLPHIGLGRPAEGEGGLRIPDPLDVLSPYLQFRYTLNGQECVHTAPVALFQNHYCLPDSTPIHFQPSRDGFRFTNSFKGYMLPFSLSFLPGADKVPGPYGLCGGMSAAACDFYLSGRSIPQVTSAPTNGKPLQRYIYRRAIDSFAMGASIARFAAWMHLPDLTTNGTCYLTALELKALRADLDNQRLVPLGLLYEKGKDLKEVAKNIWHNHQVLAYGYRDNPDGSTDVLIYNSNCDTDGNKQDQGYIHAEPVLVTQPGEAPAYGVQCVERGLVMNNVRYEPRVYGFFRMPYTPVDPPDGLA